MLAKSNNDWITRHNSARLYYYYYNGFVYKKYMLLGGDSLSKNAGTINSNIGSRKTQVGGVGNMLLYNVQITACVSMQNSVLSVIRISYWVSTNDKRKHCSKTKPEWNRHKILTRWIVFEPLTFKINISPTYWASRNNKSMAGENRNHIFAEVRVYRMNLTPKWENVVVQKL